MSESLLNRGPFRYDEWQWVMDKDGDNIAKCPDESDAAVIVAALNAVYYAKLATGEKK